MALPNVKAPMSATFYSGSATTRRWWWAFISAMQITLSSTTCTIGEARPPAAPARPRMPVFRPPGAAQITGEPHNDAEQERNSPTPRLQRAMGQQRLHRQKAAAARV
ncbi:hypothetical protein ACIBJI_25800 [Nocardia sp. NPDC050408]|uniref:hypothetical protein n=1 Tax=unclassified Nocardia TaxID=2637762 RepID=UPI003431C398